jgi:hypothetical protein
MIPQTLVGSGCQDRSCVDLITFPRVNEIVGFAVQICAKESPIPSHPSAGNIDAFDVLTQNCPMALIAVGQIKTPLLWTRLSQWNQYFGGTFPMVTSPRAYVSIRVKLGADLSVKLGTALIVGANIGIYCIVNSLELGEHDLIFGSHTLISIGVRGHGSFFTSRGTLLDTDAAVNKGVSAVPEGNQVTVEW